jgi:hypothetical protein
METSELQRISLVVRERGIDGAIDWARQTMRTYRRSVLQDGRNGRPFHFASHGNYRRRFIESYLQMKRFVLKAAEKHTQIGQEDAQNGEE